MKHLNAVLLNPYLSINGLVELDTGDNACSWSVPGPILPHNATDTQPERASHFIFKPDSDLRTLMHTWGVNMTMMQIVFI